MDPNASMLSTVLTGARYSRRGDGPNRRSRSAEPDALVVAAFGMEQQRPQHPGEQQVQDAGEATAHDDDGEHAEEVEEGEDDAPPVPPLPVVCDPVRSDGEHEDREVEDARSPQDDRVDEGERGVQVREHDGALQRLRLALVHPSAFRHGPIVPGRVPPRPSLRSSSCPWPVETPTASPTTATSSPEAPAPRSSASATDWSRTSR